MLSVVMVRTVVIPSKQKSNETKYFMVTSMKKKKISKQKDLENRWDGMTKFIITQTKPSLMLDFNPSGALKIAQALE